MGLRDQWDETVRVFEWAGVVAAGTSPGRGDGSCNDERTTQGLGGWESHGDLVTFVHILPGYLDAFLYNTRLFVPFYQSSHTSASIKNPAF